MKYCIHCVYYTQSPTNLNSYDEDAKCSHPDLLSPVTGEPVAFCKIERSAEAGRVYPCGKEAKLFKSKN